MLDCCGDKKGAQPLQLNSQNYHNNSKMENWLVIFQKEGRRLGGIPRSPLDFIKLEEDIPRGSCDLQEMEEGRQRQARCISNYFNIPSIAAFVKTLVAIAQALRIDPQPLMVHLEQAKIKTESTSLENAEQTTRSRIELCYSRRWRELQFTIYLLIQQYETPQRCKRTRVLVINQRGLILQCLSNVNSESTFIFAGKVLKTSYTRLQNLVVLSPCAGQVDLDSIGILKEAMPAVNIVMVTYGDRAVLQGLSRGRIGAAEGFYMVDCGIKLRVYKELSIILWYVEQNNEQILQDKLLGLVAILKCELQVSNYFKDFRYNHHQFNQKQFLLRLFSFYFNFVALGMESQSEDEKKAAIFEDCTQQLLGKQRQLEVRNGEGDVHAFTTMPTSLHCPVCRRRSKITCLKCCAEFGSKFAICEVECFEKFHQNRIGYAGNINKRKKVNDLLIQNRDKDQKETLEKEGGNEPALSRVQTMEELRDKWKATMEGYQKHYTHFVRMSELNFIPQKFVDRMNLLRSKICQITTLLPSKQAIVKKEQ